MQWSAHIHTRFHVSGATLDTPKLTSNFNYGTITLFGRPFHTVLLSSVIPYRSPNPERINPSGLGFSPFARHYTGNRVRFLLLCFLRCFTSAGIALSVIYILTEVIDY